MTEDFRTHPHPSEWDNYTDYESTSWPRKDRRKYWIIPSVCFNCESACGILAYVDQETLDVRKIEGNPIHPGSRGRTCAKGVVTPNQLEDPDRILYPMRRTGERGEGRWQQVSWNEALEDIGGRIRKAIVENRRRAQRDLRAVHAGVRRSGDRGDCREDRRSRAGDRPRRHPVRDTQLARGRGGESLGLANHSLSVPAGGTHGLAGHGGRREHARDEQVHPETPEPAAPAGILERTALPPRVPAGVLRDELPASALPQGRARQAGCLFHARL
ncbi:MAG: molybdopterin-dependent oxidoreductase [Acidobacteria bacterium]|nr:molybdopterin-dependent oxidoreductase [Acidobacteriota bacterium]